MANELKANRNNRNTTHTHTLHNIHCRLNCVHFESIDSFEIRNIPVSMCVREKFIIIKGKYRRARGKKWQLTSEYPDKMSAWKTPIEVLICVSVCCFFFSCCIALCVQNNRYMDFFPVTSLYQREWQSKTTEKLPDERTSLQNTRTYKQANSFAHTTKTSILYGISWQDYIIAICTWTVVHTERKSIHHFEIIIWFEASNVICLPQNRYTYIYKYI